MRAPPAIGQTTESGAFHTELLGNFITECLRAFRVVRTKIHIHEPPGMTFGNLSTKAIHFVVVSADGDQVRSVDGRRNDFVLFQGVGNQDKGWQYLQLPRWLQRSLQDSRWMRSLRLQV